MLSFKIVRREREREREERREKELPLIANKLKSFPTFSSHHPILKND